MVPTIKQDDTVIQKVDSKSKKDEILSAYQQLLKKMSDNAEKTEERKSEIAHRHEDEIVDKASKYAIDAIVQKVADLESTIRKWLTDLIEALMKEAQKLKEIQEANEIEKKNLEHIHQIKVEADTLVNLVQAHKDKKHDLEEDIEQKQEEWRREEEKYEYELQLNRKHEEDEYYEKRSVKERELKEREDQITQHEKEFEELKQLKEVFDQKLEDEVKKGRLEVAKEIRKEEEVRAQILWEKTTAEKKIAELTIESLKKQLVEREQDMLRLKKELEIANQGVKEVALKVIEGNARIVEQHRSLKGYESEKNFKEEKMTA